MKTSRNGLDCYTEIFIPWILQKKAPTLLMQGRGTHLEPSYHSTYRCILPIAQDFVLDRQTIIHCSSQQSSRGQKTDVWKYV